MTSVVRIAKALRTPRVEMIEKAHMERAYVDMREEDIDRIEIFGEMQVEVWETLFGAYRYDPFEGHPVLTFGGDQRTAIGKTVDRIPKDVVT